MQLCYIDESGDTGSFTLDNVNSQPVFLLTALFMPQERLVKGVGEEFDGTSVYASAVQRIITAFDNYIGERKDKGVAILDSRNKNKNAPLAHSLFTWNFSSHGHEYDRLAELPLFGHSENHAMIQLADWVSSAFLFPMTSYAYCLEHEVACLHIDKAYAVIQKMFGQRLKALQYRYALADGSKRGGIYVQGKSAKLNPLQLFGDPPVVA